MVCIYDFRCSQLAPSLMNMYVRLLSKSLVLILVALFSVAPILVSCILSLLYSIYLFMAYEEAGIHHAQEHENRFWTILALLLSTALFFAKDSPVRFGVWSPSLGLLAVVLCGYLMHLWDRHVHRIAISQQTKLRRSSTQSGSLSRLRDLGIPIEDHLAKINECLQEIDQLLIPSTINNLINTRFVLSKEREIIRVCILTWLRPAYKESHSTLDRRLLRFHTGFRGMRCKGS